jgi:hypothetical protein
MSEDRVYLLDLNDCATWNGDRWVTLREAMSEPTINELLKWLVTQARTDDPHVIAIRAILEQHKILGTMGGFELQAVRAFVERVEKRPLSAAPDFQDGVYDELAAMEKPDLKAGSGEG